MLTRSDADRAALIGRFHLREDAAWLAELLIDIEEDELVRLQITDALRRSSRVTTTSSGHIGSDCIPRLDQRLRPQESSRAFTASAYSLS